MGIAKDAFSLLVEEAKKGRFEGKKILQLGRQHTFITFSEAVDLAKKAGFQYHHPSRIQLSFYNHLKELNFIDDNTLFSLLGFSEIHSLDASSFEQASFIHDLNTPIPPELCQKYDVIFDGGTLEHVFHVPQVLKNIHNLLKDEGIIIHASPSHNHVDHGFYMFSPTLFHEYYSTNFYKILTSYIFEYDLHGSSWKIFQYEPGSLNSLSFGGFGKKMLGIWFIAQKQQESTEGVLPQQGNYKVQWAEASSSSEPKKVQRKFLSLKKWLKKSAFVRNALIRFHQFKIKSFGLKRVKF